MDAILQGILSSSHPDPMKKQLISVIAKKGSKPHPVTTITAVLKVATDWILESESDIARDGGMLVFKSWVQYNLSTFEDFFNREYLLELLQKKVCNMGSVITLLHESMNFLQRSIGFQTYTQLIQTSGITYVREHPNVLCLSNFVTFLNEYQNCIPKGDFTSTFCVSLIQSLSLCSVPDKNTDVFEFIKQVEIICSFINNIWNNTDSVVVMDSLNAIFRIISTVGDSDLEPSICLGGMAQYVPLEMINVVVKSTINNKDVDNKSMTAVLQRIIDWQQWPTSKNIDQWVVAFLKGLAAEKRYSVLIKVTESKIDKVFEKICIPLIRDGAINVSTQMLLSFQHSPEPFHKVLSCVPRVIQVLKQDKSAEEDLKRVAELLHCCMYLHAGYPDLYDPVVEHLKGLSAPGEQVIKERLQKSKWTSQQGDTTKYVSKVKQKSVTGKTGLFNLGNTCYMNSVMQAIYMCDDFRRSVMSHPVSTDQTLMLKLQYTFAFLTLTQRPAYAPVNFLSAARPPWFTAGHQQDCSEFLKYMFDQLHEQEYATAKKSATQDTSIENGDCDGASSTKIDNSESFSSLVRQKFGGCSKTTVKCSNCLKESFRSEHFIDIPLAFPENQDVDTSKKNGVHNTRANGDTAEESNACTDKKTLHLNDLIQHYLKPEKLTGDNKYHCDACGGLQDGERSINITTAPNHLILTLLRFSYNIKTHTRSKISEDVKYPRTLILPIENEHQSHSVDTIIDKRKSLRSAVTGHINNCGVDTRTNRGEVYALSGVVVHSGTSSECGHYYAYARHSVFNDPSMTCDNLDQYKTEDEVDFLQEKWYLFNDCRVSYANYKSFCDVTERFSKDTAYMLIYKRITQQTGNVQEHDLNKSLHASEIDPPLRTDLRTAVTKDNAMFLQEQENAEVRKNRKRHVPTSSVWNHWQNGDDEDPPGSCGGGSGFGLDGPKFVF